MEFDAFFIHNSKDKPIVEEIARELQDAHGLKCRLDEWNLLPGEPWLDVLEEALDECQTIAIFVGPNQIDPWENKGMRSALVKRVQDKSHRVLPVLLPGAPKYRDVRLPIFLRRLIWVDFRSGLNDKNLHRLYAATTGKRPGSPETALFPKEKNQNFLSEQTTERSDTTGELIELAEYLGHLPITFELAGRYLQRDPSISLQEYLTQLENVLEDPSVKNWQVDLKDANKNRLRLLQTLTLSWRDIKNEKSRKIFIMEGIVLRWIC